VHLNNYRGWRNNKMVVLKHEQMVIDALVDNGIVDAKTIRELMVELISRIGMELLTPDGTVPWTNPNAAYCFIPGNRGVTCSAIIQTSHIAMHVWDECQPAKFHLDVYSCSKLDPDAVFAWMADHFAPVSAQGYFIDRDNDKVTIKNEIVKVW
jgi:S-adenosylmethionine/arginine decarboxylase-like enzyme